MENNSLLSLSPAQLRKAAALKERIDELNDELGALLGGASAKTVAAVATGGRGGRRHMSAAGRAKIAAAARARWARVRAEKGGSAGSSAAPKSPRKGKRTMSPEARAKIAAAARARWARVRAGK